MAQRWAHSCPLPATQWPSLTALGARGGAADGRLVSSLWAMGIWLASPTDQCGSPREVSGAQHRHGWQAPGQAQFPEGSPLSTLHTGGRQRGAFILGQFITVSPSDDSRGAAVMTSDHTSFASRGSWGLRPARSDPATPAPSHPAWPLSSGPCVSWAAVAPGGVAL